MLNRIAKAQGLDETAKSASCLAPTSNPCAALAPDVASEAGKKEIA